jgi:hypothetical protein
MSLTYPVAHLGGGTKMEGCQTARPVGADQHLRLYRIFLVQCNYVASPKPVIPSEVLNKLP